LFVKILQVTDFFLSQYCAIFEMQLKQQILVVAKNIGTNRKGR